MAKNTSSTTFRKIDVDQYNEDNFKIDESAETGVPSNFPDDAEITSLINQGKLDEALITVLKNAPMSVKNRNPQIKDKALRLMMKVMLSIKSSQMDDVIQRLDIEQVDTLMKYIYKGFETPTEGSSAHLLIWHEKAFAVGGLGSIVRVLTDNKRV
ncbi:actin-related protein 2/3 complex subunit 5-B [Planococcus citri]|uniref:actin-related protein 2/3 complex subunit 5-B n=1 Tax=Planococcus citri TaxID=170843 RepID=UPI0031F97794